MSTLDTGWVTSVGFRWNTFFDGGIIDSVLHVCGENDALVRCELVAWQRCYVCPNCGAIIPFEEINCAVSKGGGGVKVIFWLAARIRHTVSRVNQYVNPTQWTPAQQEYFQPEILRLIGLVQDNPEFFGAKLADSCLEKAADKLEELIEEHEAEEHRQIGTYDELTVPGPTAAMAATNLADAFREADRQGAWSMGEGVVG